MILTRKRTRRWLPAALWLTITPLIGHTDTQMPWLQSDARLMISIDDCSRTCALELAKAISECRPTETMAPNPVPESSSVSIRTCESDCETSLHSLKGELEDACDASQDEAVAAERRLYEPQIAQLTAERDVWIRATEHALRDVQVWMVIAGVAGAVAVGSLVVAIVL